MSLNSFYKLGSLWCQFNDFELGGFWNFWQWKLNPYQRFDFVDISRILNVRKAIGTKTNFRCDHQHLVLTETCGFFDKQVYGSSECGTKWSLVRRKRKGDAEAALSSAHQALELALIMEKKEVIPLYQKFLENNMNYSY